MDLDDLYRLLRGAHVQAQGIVDTVDDPLLVTDEDLCVLSANPAFYRTFATSKDETLGKCFLKLGDGQWDLPDLQLLLERVIPKSAAVVDFEVSSNFPHLGHRTMMVTAKRLVHPDDGRRLLLLSLVDATERKTKDVAADLALGELQHRLKNILALAQALAKQTRVEGRTAEEYRDAFLGRFAALTRALDASMKGTATVVGDLINAVLEPYLIRANVVRIGSMPPVLLDARQAMSLGMILNELATNAVKYGALSAQTGWVTLNAQLENDAAGTDRLEMVWIEHGGPKVKSPDCTSFGTRLITCAAERDLSGHVELEFKPEGLHVSLGFPVGQP